MESDNSQYNPYSKGKKKSALRKQYGYSNTNHLKSPQKKKEQIEIRIVESPHSKFTFIS